MRSIFVHKNRFEMMSFASTTVPLLLLLLAVCSALHPNNYNLSAQSDTRVGVGRYAGDTPRSQWWNSPFTPTQQVQPRNPNDYDARGRKRFSQQNSRTGQRGYYPRNTMMDGDQPRLQAHYDPRGWGQANNPNAYYGGNTNANNPNAYYGGNTNANNPNAYYGGNTNANNRNAYYGGNTNKEDLMRVW